MFYLLIGGKCSADGKHVEFWGVQCLGWCTNSLSHVLTDKELIRNGDSEYF